MLTDILLIIQFERVDILRSDIRITDLGRIKIAVGNIRLHEEKFRTGDTPRVGSKQLMFLRERITQVEGREELELIVGTVLARDRAPQDTMGMLATHTRLEIERLMPCWK